MYTMRKRYGHELGLSASFRQWRATSHCNVIHGYPLAFEFTFVADRLNDQNWVLDFGSLKPLKAWLVDMFDHRTLVANDDPLLALYRDCQTAGMMNINVVRNVGCEAFADMAFDKATRLLHTINERSRVAVAKVLCAEHGGNSACRHSSAQYV